MEKSRNWKYKKKVKKVKKSIEAVYVEENSQIAAEALSWSPVESLYTVFSLSPFGRSMIFCVILHDPSIKGNSFGSVYFPDISLSP